VARECIGCLWDEPLDGPWHHRQDLGDGTYYRIVCTRGLIERELRAYAVRTDFNIDLSAAADRLARGCGADMERRGYDARHMFDDWMSEAIEAAAELSL
jgi:hypothetical protein